MGPDIAPIQSPDVHPEYGATLLTFDGSSHEPWLTCLATTIDRQPYPSPKKTITGAKPS